MRTDVENIAHVRKDEHGDWQTHDLGQHLNGVASKAKDFADIFGNGDWANLAGLWHDLGKFLPGWQRYIRRQTGYDIDGHIEGYNGRPNHSTAGAVLSIEQFNFSPIGRIIAYIVAGHHAGLPDWQPNNAGGDLVNRIYEDALEGKLDTCELSAIKDIAEAQQYTKSIFPKSTPLKILTPEELAQKQEHLHLWIRMLFSCLVDADFLDTESFMNPETAACRGRYPFLADLHNRFNNFMQIKINAAAGIFGADPVGAKRAG